MNAENDPIDYWTNYGAIYYDGAGFPGRGIWIFDSIMWGNGEEGREDIHIRKGHDTMHFEARRSDFGYDKVGAGYHEAWNPMTNDRGDEWIVQDVLFEDPDFREPEYGDYTPMNTNCYYMGADLW